MAFSKKRYNVDILLSFPAHNLRPPAVYTLKKKKLLVLTSTFPRWPGDSEPPFVFELCRRLANEFDVLVLAPHAQHCATTENMLGVRVHRFRYWFARWETVAYKGGILARLKQNRARALILPFFFFALIIACIRILRREKIDAIHAHWIIPQGLAATIALLLIRRRIPLLCTSHGGDLYALNGPVFRRLKRWVVNRATALTVVSIAMKRAIEHFGANRSNIYVMPMGVDLKALFTPPSRRPQHPSIIFVGRLVEKKGVDYLLHAMPQVLRSFPTVTLVVAGDGPIRPTLEALARRLGIANNTVFSGMQPNSVLPSLYRDARLAVFPFVVATGGDQEGFGLVLVEAMGCGCSVVTTSLEAVQDIARHNENSLLVPPRNSSALAEAILALLRDKHLDRRISLAARQYVERHFDWSYVAFGYRRLLNDLMHL